VTPPGAISCLDRSKSLLRGKPSRTRLEKAARQMTEWEDVLEYESPRSPHRAKLREVRRKLGARCS
jgi:hypothetical protein